MSNVRKTGVFREVKVGIRFSLCEGEEVASFLVYQKDSQSTAVCIGFVLGSQYNSNTLMHYQGKKVEFKDTTLVAYDVDEFAGMMSTQEIASRLFREAMFCGIRDVQIGEVTRLLEVLLLETKGGNNLLTKSLKYPRH